VRQTSVREKRGLLRPSPVEAGSCSVRRNRIG
jgi:hypothetical protein